MLKRSGLLEPDSHCLSHFSDIPAFWGDLDQRLLLKISSCMICRLDLSLEPVMAYPQKSEKQKVWRMISRNVASEGSGAFPSSRLLRVAVHPYPKVHRLKC